MSLDNARLIASLRESEIYEKYGSRINQEMADRIKSDYPEATDYVLSTEKGENILSIYSKNNDR